MNLNLTNINRAVHKFEKSLPQWYNLSNLWTALHPDSSIKVMSSTSPKAIDVIEYIGDKAIFWYSRDFVGSGRATTIDRYGLVGVSLVNPRDSRTVILTEGVSDFLTMKMCYPRLNVLGLTTLGGSTKAIKIVCSLFDRILMVCDNDSGKEVNTGMLNGMRIKETFTSVGKEVNLLYAESPNKDVTQQMLNELIKL